MLVERGRPPVHSIQGYSSRVQGDTTQYTAAGVGLPAVRFAEEDSAWLVVPHSDCTHRHIPRSRRTVPAGWSICPRWAYGTSRRRHRRDWQAGAALFRREQWLRATCSRPPVPQNFHNISQCRSQQAGPPSVQANGIVTPNRTVPPETPRSMFIPLFLKTFFMKEDVIETSSLVMLSLPLIRESFRKGKRLRTLVRRSRDLAPGNRPRLYVSPGEQEMETFYVSTSFGGRPIGRRLASSPKSDAVTAVHAADPNGALQLTLCRIRCTSTPGIGSFTHASHGSVLVKFES
jgi:hypothetical protein